MDQINTYQYTPARLSLRILYLSQVIFLRYLLYSLAYSQLFPIPHLNLFFYFSFGINFRRGRFDPAEWVAAGAAGVYGGERDEVQSRADRGPHAGHVRGRGFREQRRNNVWSAQGAVREAQRAARKPLHQVKDSLKQ